MSLVIASVRESPLRRLVEQFLHFAGVGAIGVVLQFLTLTGLVQFMNVNAALASCAGYALGATVNYVFNYRYTFNSDRKHAQTISRYVLLVASGFMFNGLIMLCAVELLKIHYFLSQVVATGLLLLFHFAVSRNWVFGGTGHGHGA